MNKQNLSIKILLVAAISTFFFFGLTAFSINKVKNDDILTVTKIEEAVKKTYNLKNFHISIGSNSVIVRTEDYLKKIENPKFKNIEIKAVSADIKILKTDDSSITIVADENLDSMLVTEGSDLVVEQSDHSQLSSLEIRVPESFNGEAQIKTVSGSIRINASEFSQIRINTISGDINIKNNHNSNIDIQSISGDVRIRHKTASKDFTFNLQTVSGDILNRLPSNNAGHNHITVKTVSGDIQIR